MSKLLFDLVVQPLGDAVEKMTEALRLLSLAIRGISVLRGMPEILEALNNYVAASHPEKAVDAKRHSQRINEAREEAELAKKEFENEFPVFHAQMLVYAWGLLESSIHDFLARWLIHIPVARESEELKKIKVSIAEFETMGQDERYYYIIESLEQGLAASRKKGTSRFEVLLNVYGLAGEVDDKIKRDILEFQQIRHVIVHRRGIADRKLLDACPWLSFEIGESIEVKHKDLVRYISQAIYYFVEIKKRIRIYLKIPASSKT